VKPRRRSPGKVTRWPVQGTPGIAVRAIDAFEGLSSSVVLDRLIRGRIWIGLLAFALIGIVAMQLLVLELNTGIGRTLTRVAALQRENAQLGIEDSTYSAEGRVAPLAAAAGMMLAPVGTVHFVARNPADVSHAAAVLSTAAQVSPGSSVGGEAGGGETTGAGAGGGETTGSGVSGAGTARPGASGGEAPGSEVSAEAGRPGAAGGGASGGEPGSGQTSAETGSGEASAASRAASGTSASAQNPSQASSTTSPTSTSTSTSTSTATGTGAQTSGTSSSEASGGGTPAGSQE
jgi:hypothetical protein